MPFQLSEIPLVTVEQMRDVDRLMIEKYGITLLQMMENAGRNLAELTRRYAYGKVTDKDIAVLVGKGNNGGGALAAARHLHNWGACVNILIPYQPISRATRQQLEFFERTECMRVYEDNCQRYLSGANPDFILDGLVGYGLKGNLRPRLADLVTLANSKAAKTISLDIPSGLDGNTGKNYRPCIQADATLTLALPKIGLLKQEAKPFVGSLFLADISVPAALYREINLDVEHIFTRDSIIEFDSRPIPIFQTNCQGYILG